MLDSPFAYGPVCRAYVLLDQTHRQCGREHSCVAVPKCPRRRFLTGMEFREGEESQGKREGTDSPTANRIHDFVTSGRMTDEKRRSYSQVEG